jgi:hypothetical protein
MFYVVGGPPAFQATTRAAGGGMETPSGHGIIGRELGAHEVPPGNRHERDRRHGPSQPTAVIPASASPTGVSASAAAQDCALREAAWLHSVIGSPPRRRVLSPRRRLWARDRNGDAAGAGSDPADRCLAGAAEPGYLGVGSPVVRAGGRPRFRATWRYVGTILISPKCSREADAGGTEGDGAAHARYAMGASS